jgi:hypothetical protein
LHHLEDLEHRHPSSGRLIIENHRGAH